MDPFNLVKTAFNEAKHENDVGQSDRKIHRNRSQNFVDALARAFKGYYESRNPKVHVFWSKNTAHESDFNLKELLYDIAVCEVDETRSASGRTLLSYVTKTYWIVESEFELNSRSAIVDMSKLVLGRSENLLFIGPSVGPKKGYLDMLAKVAIGCDGDLHLALIDHPSEWKSEPRDPELYLWAGNEWLQGSQSTL